MLRDPGYPPSTSGRGTSGQVLGAVPLQLRWLPPDGRRLALFVALDFAFFAAVLLWGLQRRSLELVSEALRLLFRCAVLAAAAAATAVARLPPDTGGLGFSFGFGRAEVLAAFTSGSFVVFGCVGQLVEALHISLQGNEERAEELEAGGLDLSAELALGLSSFAFNFVGMFLFLPRRGAYGRKRYMDAADMNVDGVFVQCSTACARAAAAALAAWLTASGVTYAEALLDATVAAAAIAWAFPLFKACGCVLLQGMPAELHSAVLARCLRDVGAAPDVLAVENPRFWALEPGKLVGTVCVIVSREANEQAVLRQVRGVFERALGPFDLTVQVTKEVR